MCNLVFQNQYNECLSVCVHVNCHHVWVQQVSVIYCAFRSISRCVRAYVCESLNVLPTSLQVYGCVCAVYTCAPVFVLCYAMRLQVESIFSSHTNNPCDIRSLFHNYTLVQCENGSLFNVVINICVHIGCNWYDFFLIDFFYCAKESVIIVSVGRKEVVWYIWVGVYGHDARKA